MEEFGLKPLREKIDMLVPGIMLLDYISPNGVMYRYKHQLGYNVVMRIELKGDESFVKYGAPEESTEYHGPFKATNSHAPFNSIDIVTMYVLNIAKY